MGNIHEHGYELLRTHIIANWKYLELQTPTGAVLKRFSQADGLSITGSPTSPTIEYRITVTGITPEFTGKKVNKSVIYAVATGGTPIATESFTEFTFVENEDELTVKHVIEVPKVI